MGSAPRSSPHPRGTRPRQQGRTGESTYPPGTALDALGVALGGHLVGVLGQLQPLGDDVPAPEGGPDGGRAGHLNRVRLPRAPAAAGGRPGRADGGHPDPQARLRLPGRRVADDDPAKVIEAGRLGVGVLVVHHDEAAVEAQLVGLVDRDRAQPDADPRGQRGVPDVGDAGLELAGLRQQVDGRRRATRVQSVAGAPLDRGDVAGRGAAVPVCLLRGLRAGPLAADGEGHAGDGGAGGLVADGREQGALGRVDDAALAGLGGGRGGDGGGHQDSLAGVRVRRPEALMVALPAGLRTVFAVPIMAINSASWGRRWASDAAEADSAPYGAFQDTTDQVAANTTTAYAMTLNTTDYSKAEHILPHDVRVRELGTGKSRLEMLEESGLEIKIAPRMSLDDGIQAVRRILPRCWFNVPKVQTGLNCLRNYRRDYDEKRKI